MSDLLAIIFFIWGCISAIVQPDEKLYPMIFLVSGVWALCANTSRIYSLFYNDDEEELIE